MKRGPGPPVFYKQEADEEIYLAANTSHFFREGEGPKVEVRDTENNGQGTTPMETNWVLLKKLLQNKDPDSMCLAEFQTFCGPVTAVCFHLPLSFQNRNEFLPDYLLVFWSTIIC